VQAPGSAIGGLSADTLLAAGVCDKRSTVASKPQGNIIDFVSTRIITDDVKGLVAATDQASSPTSTSP